MTLVLKGVKPGNQVLVTHSKEIEAFLLRNGVEPGEETDKGIVFHVDDPYAVYQQINKAGIL